MNVPEHMKAVLLTGHGGLDQLEYRDDVAVPKLVEGEVLIRVGAAGVNNTDINTRIGWYSKSISEGTSADGGDDMAEKAESDDATWGGTPLHFPRIQGADVCGEIVKTSIGSDSGRLGERVLIEPCLRDDLENQTFGFSYFGSECDGGFAQYTKVDSVFAHAVKSDLSDAELASFPCSYSTAENMLERSNVADGERVLITGASGGVGSAAVQLAKRRGAKVIAVAGASKVHKVMDLGADNVIPRGSSPVAALGSKSIDVVIDLVGGPDWPELLDVLVPGGRYATSGAIAGPITELDLRTLYLKDLSLFGCTSLGPEVFKNLVGYIEKDEIKPLVAETFPLHEIGEAQEAFLSKKHTGKLVLIPPAD
jgi:NADPH:quinone reductase-like Zn-dependent oxidoreductase